jgi:hypothetical protein
MVADAVSEARAAVRGEARIEWTRPAGTKGASMSVYTRVTRHGYRGRPLPDSALECPVCTCTDLVGQQTYDVTAKNPDAKHPPDGDAVGCCATHELNSARSATVENILRTRAACVC